MTRRRDLLILTGIVGAAFGLSWWLQRPDFEFFPLNQPAGFRRLALGAVSGTNVFAGLDDPDPRRIALASTLAQNPCSALFTADLAPAQVPVAVFTDINCPYCRQIDPILVAREEEGEISITWHELPLLGPTSEAGARAALAARQQDAYLPIHRRMMAGRFVPTPAFLEQIAREAGIDGERLIEDQTSEPVTEALLTDAALADVFAIPGTPSLVVGRTLVVGNISSRQLDALIDLEARDGQFPCA